MFNMSVFCEHHGLSLKAAAPIFGLSPQFLSQLKRGQRHLNHEESWACFQLTRLYESQQHHHLKLLTPQDLRTYRKTYNLSPKEAGLFFGFHPAHWGRMERGQSRIRRFVAYRIQLRAMAHAGTLTQLLLPTNPQPPLRSVHTASNPTDTLASRAEELAQVLQTQKSQIEALQNLILELRQDTRQAQQKHQATLETLKAELHHWVRCIVKQAENLPKDHTLGQYYQLWANTWRAVHRQAHPPVSRISGYTTERQLKHAISGAKKILLVLGGQPEVFLKAIS